VALSDSRARDHAVILAYVTAFAVATICHLFDIARGGWLPYTKYALGLNVFWTSLTFLDPLAIVLLLKRRRAGVCLALLIITVDVVVNDRGPFVDGRIADLSEAAARRIGMIADGVVEALLDILQIGSKP